MTSRSALITGPLAVAVLALAAGTADAQTNPFPRPATTPPSSGGSTKTTGTTTGTWKPPFPNAIGPATTGGTGGSGGTRCPTNGTGTGTTGTTGTTGGTSGTSGTGGTTGSGSGGSGSGGFGGFGFGIVPFVDTVSSWIDQRTITTNFAAEQTLTSDTVPVSVDAVLFWMVHDAQKAALEVQEYAQAVQIYLSGSAGGTGGSGAGGTGTNPMPTTGATRP